ncbi:MAG: amidohydrolase [Dehalococcoidia bacterium]|nr:amidohydrolase [Dehalococcoidia bacterium]
MADGRTSSEDGSVEFLNTKMDEAGVDKAVIVQPIHYVFDNTYVSDVLKRFPGKFAAIGLVNQFEPGAADRLEALVTEHGFSGLRIHLTRPDHPSMWAGPDQDAIWERAAKLGASFISHGPSVHYPDIEPIIARHPDVPIALDHNGGAPRIEDPPYPGMTPVLNLAKYPNVYVKLIPHKEEEPFPYKDSYDAFKRLYDAFGPQRLMWGTNFPGVERETKYAPALEVFQEHIDWLTGEDKRWLLGETAMGIYNFNEA